jgi:hypothetical protein
MGSNMRRNRNQHQQKAKTLSREQERPHTLDASNLVIENAVVGSDPMRWDHLRIERRSRAYGRLPAEGLVPF